MKYPDDQQKLNRENPFILTFNEFMSPKNYPIYGMTLWLLAGVKFAT